MKRRTYLWLGIVVLCGATIAFFLRASLPRRLEPAEFQFATVQRGDVREVISSSGPLAPTKVVLVGSQVSGIVKKVYVSSNDPVVQGQLLAEIDPSLLSADLAEAKGRLMQSEAQTAEAQTDYDRAKSLIAKGFIPESEFQKAEATLKIRKGELLCAQAAVQRAQSNLDYASVRSPIKGTVLLKAVEEGQTLASQFATPTLFEIAEDLSSMEISVAVDESDVSLIHKGQKVLFTVEAYPSRTFTGEVDKIRLKPREIANVVNYIVVVEARNDDGLLLPGMTAEASFVQDERKDVLKVSNSALRWRPDSEMLRQYAARTGTEVPSESESGKKGESGTKNRGELWYLDQNHLLVRLNVETDLSDGVDTALISSPALHEGMSVIKGTVQKSSASSTRKETGILMPGGPGGGGGGGPPPM
jgi:HlyD family secretion protein